MAVAAEARPEVRAAFMIPPARCSPRGLTWSGGPSPPCPYRHWIAFREADAEQYFGRDELPIELV